MHAELTLPPEPTSVRSARRFVSDALERDGLDEAGYTAALLVSELVTNAVLHARTPVVVSVGSDDTTVRVEVADSSPAAPRQRHHGVESGTGRGLMLVDRMARAWGVDARTGGKVVWFELDAHPEPDDLFDLDDELASQPG